MRDADGRQVGPTGFFANGVFSAINWDQVARLQQITVYESAKSSFGVSAWQNTAAGKAVRIHRHFPPALGRSINAKFGQGLQSVAQSLTSFMFQQGQVIYYAQAVDLVHQKEFFAHKSILHECLAITMWACVSKSRRNLWPLNWCKNVLPKSLQLEYIRRKDMAFPAVHRVCHNHRLATPVGAKASADWTIYLLLLVSIRVEAGIV